MSMNGTTPSESSVSCQSSHAAGRMTFMSSKSFCVSARLDWSPEPFVDGPVSDIQKRLPVFAASSQTFCRSSNDPL